MCNSKYQIKNSTTSKISNHHIDNRQSPIHTIILVDEVKFFEELFKGKTLWCSQT